MVLRQSRIGSSGWFVYPLLKNDGTALTLSASVGAVANASIQILQEADFQLHNIQYFESTGTQNGQFSCKLSTGNALVTFMSNFVLVPTIFGQGNLPHKLVEPITLPRGTIIDASFRNESADARTINFAFEGINVDLSSASAMSGLHRLSDEGVYTATGAEEEACFPAGVYGYGLNVVLPASDSGFIANNSKMVERDFVLTSVNSAFQFSTTNYSLKLGTERTDWFQQFVRVETILGDGALPHFLPGQGTLIKSGDSIVVQVRNDNATAKRIALIFQGYHI